MKKWKASKSKPQKVNPFKTRSGAKPTSSTKPNYDPLKELLALKLQLEQMKPLYSLYDMRLQEVLNSGRLNGHPQPVTMDGIKWLVEVVDGFGQKNTAWKSVATRRFDIAVSKAR